MKTVQELISTAAEGGTGAVPARFIRKAEGKAEEEAAAGPDDQLRFMDVPSIDLSLLSASEAAAADELQRFHSALSSWGCFQAINHGMTGSFLDQVREVVKEFFALPSEEKQKYLRADDSIEGYGNDMILSDQQVLDWNDRLYLSMHPEDRQKPNYWPQKPENFSAVIHEYTLKLRDIADLVLKAIALALNLDSDAFLDMFGGKVMMDLRMNYYPRCPKPGLVCGLKPHADGSAITIVLPDKEVKGLQFLRDDRWVKVPIVPQALLINIGDQAEIMTNGIFKSPMHRAIPNLEHNRISLAMFCFPSVETVVEPARDLIDDSRPGLYEKIKNYPEIYFHYYQQGKRPIDAVKL